MNRVLIDTDILSYFMKGNIQVIENVNRYLHFHESLEIRIITFYEIKSGLLAKNAFKQLEKFDEFLTYNQILPVTKNSTIESAKIYSELYQSGQLIDDIDILIAGVAIENGLSLVTNNEIDFRRISSLKVVNWNKESV